MPANPANKASRLRRIRPGAPCFGDVMIAFATPTTPREKATLVAIAANPNADIERLAALTDMETRAVREAVRYLMGAGHIFITSESGYITAAAAVAV